MRGLERFVFVDEGEVRGEVERRVARVEIAVLRDVGGSRRDSLIHLRVRHLRVRRELVVGHLAEDVRFAHVLAESTAGRVFFVAGRELDRYVVWDYVSRRKQIIA